MCLRSGEVVGDGCIITGKVEVDYMSTSVNVEKLNKM